MATSTSEPDFFTVMSSDLNTETLTIPPHIRNRMVNELSERATFKLKNSTCCAWNVRVHKTEEGGLCFKEGWEEFLYDNSLDGKGAFEFLVVEYDGKMHFSIQTYLSVQIGALVRSSLSSGNAPFNKSEEFAALSKYPAFRVILKGGNAPFNKSEEFAALSKYPAFRVILKGGNYMVIPSKFRKKHLPLRQYTFILKNSEGATWNCTGYHFKSSLRVNAGWPDFKKDNKVDNGEVCVFELESTNKTVVCMVVHFFGNTYV